MATKVTTLNNLEIAILEPRGSIIGGGETDELKTKARDLFEQGNRKLVIDLGGVTYINSTGIGALVSLGTALSMDMVLSDAFQGTWRDAAAKDVTRMFGPSCGQNWFAVTLVLVFVMGFLAGFGSLLGVIAGVIMNRFFKLVAK